MTDAPDERRDDAPKPADGSYARYRQQIEDPSLRGALLLQVRSTVQGLRQAYLLHVAGAMLGIVALFLFRPGGYVEAWRPPLIAAYVLVDLMGIGGLRGAATHPARWIVPLATLGLVIALGLTAISALEGAFNLAWLLQLVFPAMLLVNLRDARAIAPLLSEHAAWRRDASKD